MPSVSFVRYKFRHYKQTLFNFPANTNGLCDDSLLKFLDSQVGAKSGAQVQLFHLKNYIPRLCFPARTPYRSSKSGWKNKEAAY